MNVQEAQTVAPEPGVVVHTQTMTAATVTTGTGTGNDTAAAGMVLANCF